METVNAVRLRPTTCKQWSNQRYRCKYRYALMRKWEKAVSQIKILMMAWPGNETAAPAISGNSRARGANKGT
jgi:hypothetical protein